MCKLMAVLALGLSMAVVGCNKNKDDDSMDHMHNKDAKKMSIDKNSKCQSGTCDKSKAQ